MIAQTLQPFLNTRNDAPFMFFGVPTVLRATTDSTGGAFGLLESHAMPPGFGSPYHVHRNEDESFYVVEGRIAFICAGTWMVAGPGDFVFGPRNIPHGFKVVGDSPARMLLMATPGGFDNFVKDLAEPLGTPPAPPELARLSAVAAKYGIDLLGPLPDGPA